jgi:hypothetical protein
MSQLIGLILAIALGAIVTAIGYVFLGEVFNKSAIKAEAQKMITQSIQIDLAIKAFRADNTNKLMLGNSDPNTDGNCEDSEIFTQMIDGGYLQPSVITTGGFNWCIKDGEDKISTVAKNNDICLSVNAQHIKTKYPKEGITDGYQITSSITALSAEIEDGTPICGTPTATNAACCAEP